MSKFDILRPLTPGEYAGLKADIAAHGQAFPIVHDQNGVTLDGHHRERILAELGIKPKIEQRSFGSDAERTAFVLSANLQRRQMTMEDRQALAVSLSIKGKTQAEIAKELGVSQRTISEDLRDLEVTSNSPHPKTATNPKGAGRRKGTGKSKGTGRPGSRRHKSRDAVEVAAAEMQLDAGKSREAIAEEIGISEHRVRLSTERELGRRETMEALLTAAEAKKFDARGELSIAAAIRIQKAHQDKQFAQIVQTEVLKRIAAADDAMRQHNKELLKENFNLHQSLGAQGVFTLDQFNALRKAMHPDRIQRFGDAKLIEECNQATQLLTEKKDRLIYIPRKSKVRA